MIFNLPLLVMAAFSYMLLLFFIAYATDQGWISKRIATHPVTFCLSLGVYATSWTYYGSVGFAQEQGYNFLAIHIGVTLAFLLTPVLLMPILRLTRDYQLTSLADLFAFRYRSQLVGILVTLFMLIGVLPYMALQIRAVTESIHIVTKEASPDLLSLGFCVFLTVFAILFGARHITPKEKHQGLVVAIAFESVVKLVVLMAVGVVALLGVWGGFDELSQWLASHPQAVQRLYQPVQQGPWNTLLLLSFAAAFLLPRQFHMIFTENNNPQALYIAAWAFPLVLLLLNLPIPLLLWAGENLQLEMSADYYVLGVALAEGGHSPLPVLAFIGGISASSGMMIVTTLALASMCLNHLLLPASYPHPVLNLYRWLHWGRRAIIALILMASYGFYELLEHRQGLVQLGLISFVAVAQFLPGIIGVLWWRRANRAGLIAGLLAGFAVWSVTLLLPVLESSGIIGTEWLYLPSAAGQDKWTYSTFWSLMLNSVLFASVSLIVRSREEELEAAQACIRDTLTPPSGRVITARSIHQVKDQLASVIGREIADKEVDRALNDLDMDPQESRPAELRQLREQLERNLSGLIGPQLAHMIVNQRLRLTDGAQTALAYTMRYVEERLVESRARLRGMAAELDVLHRYYRQILLDLPLGVCALTPNRQVSIWNLAMEQLSSLEASHIIGQTVKALPNPWRQLLSRFAQAEENHVYRMRLTIGTQVRWLNLHKATVLEPSGVSVAETEPKFGLVMLFEDRTDLETLEAELVHSDRLASIGQLAAGVAHEIGNPVTGIACLAQNLRGETQTEEIDSSVQQILDQTRRITNIVQSLINFSHGGSDGHAHHSLDLCEVVRQAMNFVNLTHHGKQLDYRLRCPEIATIKGDDQRLVQVVVNLLTNARDASETGSRIEVDVELTNDSVTMDIKDNGKGIAEQDLERIFEPFYTTKLPGEGTGLGLSLVYKIIQDHGGRIDVKSRLGYGTLISVRLPKAG